MYPPYNFAVAVVPSDTVNLARPCDALSVGGAGTVTVVLTNDAVVAFTCAAGQLLPVQAKRVNAAGTAATFLVALNRI